MLCDLTPAVLAEIRADAVATMRDTCRIGTRGAPSDRDPGAHNWTYGDEIPCGHRPRTTGEVLADGSHATLSFAEIRLPWGTVTEASGRVRITKIAGEAVSGHEYGIEGADYGNLVCLRIAAKRLTGDTTL